MDFSVPPDLYMDESIFKGSYEPQFESKTFSGNFSVTPVFSPDTSVKAICDMIESANESIYIEQMYIYKNWSKTLSPFIERLVNKSKQGLDVKVILNYNPYYGSTNDKCNQTKRYFESYGIEVKFVYTNWSYFTNIHNKGMIVDNKSVLVSSINWNEDSVTLNREAGIIINNEDVARYYSNVFFYDWNLSSPQSQKQEINLAVEHKNTIYIAIVFTLTFALIARDWRKRQWT
jgi:phosphatidylserine/phosphatidylglycerophosphate/cardiolipin synthase-like enzyme